MRAVIQRVSLASVSVDGAVIGAIGRGILLFAGFGAGDSSAVLSPMAEKIVNLRIFPDERGRFHLSLKEISGEILLVPQFTLFADTSKGRRPEFFGAMNPTEAETFFSSFVQAVESIAPGKVAKGKFGADMSVSLVNEGPVTISLEL